MSAGKKILLAGVTDTNGAKFQANFTHSYKRSAQVRTSLQAATEVLYRAQSEYERASLWLASNDSIVHSSDVYRTRLAALDQMMAASRAALRESPQDPVLNHYFHTASAAREATLQALSVTLPVDKTLERY